LQNAISLSERYIQDKFLPDKAIDLIDEAAAATKIRNADVTSIQKEREAHDALAQIQSNKREAVIEERFEDAMRLKEEEARLNAFVKSLHTEETTIPTPAVTEESIARVLSRSAGIPLEDLLSTDLTRLLSLEEQLRERVLGQEPAIDVVAGALRRAKTGIAHPSRPLASFLFLGPSGVGKTELAKTIAKNLFHSNKHFIRLDMSEYSEGFTMSKLIGAPAGYVGYKENANLTDRVKQRPYSVILFDEIEKAHRDVQNLLLQILEEGELTDATGRKINFKNTIIILTSNVGLERFERGDLGFLEGAQARTMSLTDDIRTELTQRFRPELVNRIDHTCMFQALTENVIDDIVKKQLKELEERLGEQGLTLKIHDDIVPHIRTLAEPKYGARNIRSHIQKEIEHKIAERISKKDRPKKLRVKINRKNVHVTRMTR
ncbi:MAG: ATP-dependent Clp protease ATP-binding subunit, partial [bacterium]|nr:ATP-dependent Clp protease ATP-binding subunit [bacterium]